MKNKIIALTLSIILGLSSTSALAAERTNNANFNYNDFFNSFNMNYSAPATTKAEYAQAKSKDADTYKVENNEIENNTNNNFNRANYETNNSSTRQTTNNTRTSNSNYESKVVELVNVERQKNGLQALALDSAISNVARTKSKDMADNNYFAHQSPRYGSAGDMLKQNGINWTAWGENIASGQRTPEAVVNAWMNSEGHRANILSPNFTKLGVGYVTNTNGTPYWTQMFAR